MLCTMGAGLSPNIGTQVTFRFLAGVFGSTPLVCAGGTISDLWTPFEQIYILPIYATGGFLGLAVGPAIGGLIGESQTVGWRWVEWTTLIISASVLLLVVLVQPETYAPILLRWKACITNGEEKHPTIPGDLVGNLARSFYRPFLMASSEPVIILISIYLCVLYIIVFTFLPGYAFIFTGTYGFDIAARGLTFLAMGVGFLGSLILVIPITAIVRKQLYTSGNLAPESCLHFAMCGAPMVPISLLWMGWTTRPSISPWSAICASGLFGFGVLCIFFSSYQYIIYRYKGFAASGLVFVTVSRYLAAGGMVVVGIPMYRNMGVHWTLTILGCIGGVLVPIPFFLFWYGASLRQRGRPSA
jgi:MFS family permease